MAKADVLNKERDFHDAWANSINLNEVMVDEFFEACTSPENRIIMKKLGDIKGKKILELGCGLGEASVYMAKKGGIVTSTDISNGMLEVVNKLAEKHGVKVETKQSYSHNLCFKDESFDIVYAANLLHHVDLEPTIKEAFRVLKKGGCFVTWDPVAHNPLINIYRRIATKVRTEDEHPLKMKEINIFKKYFSKVNVYATWFFTLWIFIDFYLLKRIDPNKERYWKKILVEHKKLESKYNKLEMLDRGFLKLFPFMKRFCWNVVVCSIK